MTWCFAAVLLGAGCGRLSFDPPSGDASTTGALFGGFADDFDDGVQADFWDSYEDTPPGSTFAEVGGAFDISLANNVDQSYAGYVSGDAYTLRGSMVTIEVVERPAAALGGGCYVNLVTPDQESLIEFGIDVDGLSASLSGTTLITTAFGASTRWLRMREDAGTVSWQTSADATGWTTVATAPTPASVGQLRLNIGGGTYDPVPALGHCIYDNLNR